MTGHAQPFALKRFGAKRQRAGGGNSQRAPRGGELPATGAACTQGKKNLERFGAKRQRQWSLAGTSCSSYNLYMRTSRVAGLLFLATATLAQQQSVEITSEPSHHLVFQNEYVRVFDVTVAPRATTLIHKHNHDYLFVTLGDSDVVSERVGEKPAALQLKDGEVRYTPGNFAHAAINKSDRPFHNITIELLKPSTNVKTCTEACESAGCIASILSSPGDNTPLPGCPGTVRRLAADQWAASMVGLPQNSTLNRTPSGPTLLIAVTKLDLERQSDDTVGPFKRGSGGFDWIPGGRQETMRNATSMQAQFITLEFKPEKQNQ
jgi:quercetin dioxygenase-like cupin family protein